MVLSAGTDSFKRRRSAVLELQEEQPRQEDIGKAAKARRYRKSSQGEIVGKLLK